MNKKEKCNKIVWGGELLEYKEKIIEIIEHTENLDYLEFIYNMMIAFKKKWGI